jgi:hypothetical protein
MKRKVLGLNSARLYGMNPDVRRYSSVPDDYRHRIASDTRLMHTMEYDDGLPKELPEENSPRVASPPTVSPYGAAVADRGDRLEQLRADHREAAETRFGTPRRNHRDGWVRVR